MKIHFLLLIYLLFLILDICSSLVHNYYIGKIENRNKMETLMVKSKRRLSYNQQETAISETLTYPDRLGPYGGKIEAVHVRVAQSMAEGRVFISKGEIGNTQIEIVVEADRSTYLFCNYTIYGVRPFERKKRVKFNKYKEIKRDEL